MTTKPSPFTLHIPDADIADLRDRLARSRFPDQAPGEPWAYGTDVGYLRGLTEYWRTGFDWRAEEAALNAFPQFRVPLDDIDWSVADPLPLIVERFHRRHEELYTYPLPDQEAVLVNARVAVAGILSALPQEPALADVPPAAPRSERRIYLDDWVSALVWDFDALAPAQKIAGPAIVEAGMTTVLLRPGDRAIVTKFGWLDIPINSGPDRPQNEGEANAGYQ